MNTCIKCGCQEAYPSLPPCPTPAACPNPQPCSEVFDAQCIVFTLPDILCGLDIVVAEDSSVAEALDSIVSYFCERISVLVQSVTGLNTDNTDPQNPIIRISVDGTTITGLGTPASPLIATGVNGSGTLNYVAKWTPDGNTLGDSIIQSIGDQVSIGALPDTVSKVYINNSTYSSIQKITQAKTTGINNALSVQSSGIGATANSAIVGSASGATVNIAVSGSVSGSGTNYGGFFQSSNATTNIGVYGQASGTGIKYSAQLLDTTEGIGKVLTCMTVDGKANWVTPSGGIGGSGINDYIARWTPDGSTLGTGVIRDNGTTIGISNNPISTAKVSIISAVPNGISLVNNYLGTNATGINITVTGANSFSNEGIVANAQNSTGNNRGVRGIANSTVGTNIGLSGAAVNGPVNYAIELIDGTEGIGKVLTCVTSDGKAHWATPATPPGAMTWSTLTGINPSALMLPNNGYIIRDTSGFGTLLTLPVYGTCSIGDKIEIIAAGATPATLSNWSIDPGQLGDTIYASFSVPSGFDILEQTFTTGGLGLPITFNGAVVGAANCRKVSMTLVCIKDNGSSYIWQLTTATNYNLVP